MLVSHSQKTMEILFFFRTSLHRKEVDDLDQEPGMAVARISDIFNQLAQAGDESIVTNAQQWAAGNVANPGRLNDQDSRPSLCETSIPIEVLLRDEAVFGGAPGHHRRHPGAALSL